MSSKRITIPVSSAVGKVSGVFTLPANAVCVLTLAHGAGAGMDHSFMVNLSEALAAIGIGTLRFNFPFAENKKGRPDSPAVAHQTIEAAIQKAQELEPALPLFASGKSFGGRMSSQYLSEHPEAPVQGIIFYGFPLHPAGKPSIDRSEHLKAVKVPMLFLQGTKDTLAQWDLIQEVCGGLKKAKLVKLEGADHSFKAGKQDIMSLLVKATGEWVEKIVNKKAK
ncbi:alpha/beta hydrolase family protein [Longitalea arenae]|uniref:alpha/beta hydrolase family protein n=1 Tax=Longitalea arenae TaxID=2812558 RepID=UPI001966F647|nr:alpha/beta family hydrolase [Longitalea arenae]